MRKKKLSEQVYDLCRQKKSPMEIAFELNISFAQTVHLSDIKNKPKKTQDEYGNWVRVWK